jgi:hypothetical protein
VVLVCAATLLLASSFLTAPGAAAPPKPAPAAPPAAKSPKTAPAAKQPPALQPVALVPRGWDRSIYNLDGRVVTSVNDVSFVAPPAYQESFAFWTSRMKGGQRTELIQLLTTTRERAEDGSLPFRRQVSRFQVDIYEQGQVKTPAGGLTQQVQALIWEGALDPLGNVRSISVTSAPESRENVDQLSFELLERMFPQLRERRDMKPGDSFSDSFSMRLPQRLSIKGLEDTAVLVKRAFTLREIRGDEAIFHLRLTYEADPATPPTVPRTTCVIAGDGAGEAAFDRQDGLFVRSQIESRMVIDLEAPLRRLPDQAEDFDPGTAKSRIELGVTVSGTQILAKLFGDSTVAPAAGASPEGQPPAGETPAEKPPAPGD